MAWAGCVDRRKGQVGGGWADWVAEEEGRGKGRGRREVSSGLG